MFAELKNEYRTVGIFISLLGDILMTVFSGIFVYSDF